MGITTYGETRPRMIGNSLQLRQEPGGMRHYLGSVNGGRPVHCGDTLYVLIEEQWVPTRYEAAWVDGKPEARLVLMFPSAGGFSHVEIRPPSDALFRWSLPAWKPASRWPREDER